MENKNQESKENVAASKNPGIRVFLERSIVYVILATVTTGFAVGIGAYRTFLDITNQETVIKDTCILKEDIVGPLLKTEAAREIDHLIETGQSLGSDEAKTRIWLMQVLAFIHTLKLEKDYEWQENQQAPVIKVPAVEADLRYALLDPSIEIQAQKTLGVLKGFRAGLEARVS